jgi:hypothetical protein
MSPGELQLKRGLLANRVELEIIMFETETVFIVSSVRPFGGFLEVEKLRVNLKAQALSNVAF